MEQTDTPPHRRNYRIRCDRVWAVIRGRYLAGESAPRLAEVFDVSEAAIRKRAQREGWTKRAAAEAMPFEPADAGLAAVIEGQLDGDLTPREAARLALNEAVKLVRGGKMGLAVEAARVADVMGRAAARLGDEGPVDMGPDEAAFEAVRRKVLGLPPPSREGAATGAGPLHHPSDGPPPPMGEE
jgi:hypothetical protein